MQQTFQNYNGANNRVDVRRLPSALVEGHEFFSEAAEFYDQDPDIKATIDLYLLKLNEYLASQEKKVSQLKSENNAQKKEKSQPTSKKAKSSFTPQSRGKKPVSGKFKYNDLVYLIATGMRHSVKSAEKIGDKVLYTLENGQEYTPDQLSHDKPKAFPKPKAAKAKPERQSAKAKKEKKRHATKEKPAFEGKKVKVISPEVAFIKRYVNMNGKEKAYSQVLSLLTGLQKAISAGSIRKTAVYADDIMQIQTNLLSALNTKKNQLKLVNNEKDLAKWVSISGGERTYESINLLRSYLNMQGKEADPERVSNLLARAKKANLSEDPYEDRVKKMIHNLEKALKKVGILDIEKVELSGLSGLMGHLQTGHAKAHRGRMTSEQLMNSQYESYPLTGKFKTLLGSPAIGANIMVHGMPGQGKTTFALQLAREFAKLGKVLYVSGEESGSVTLQDKLRRAGGATPNLVLDDQVPPDVHEFNFLFLDSVQSLKFKLEEFDHLKKANPRLTTVFILQSTKAGNFKGAQGWEHDVDTVIVLSEGKAQTTKNRYQHLSTIPIW